MLSLTFGLDYIHQVVQPKPTDTAPNSLRRQEHTSQLHQQPYALYAGETILNTFLRELLLLILVVLMKCRQLYATTNHNRCFHHAHLISSGDEYSNYGN